MPTLITAKYVEGSMKIIENEMTARIEVGGVEFSVVSKAGLFLTESAQNVETGKTASILDAIRIKGVVEELNATSSTPQKGEPVHPANRPIVITNGSMSHPGESQGHLFSFTPQGSALTTLALG